jgi:hypothetical protein
MTTKDGQMNTDEERVTEHAHALGPHTPLATLSHAGLLRRHLIFFHDASTAQNVHDVLPFLRGTLWARRSEDRIPGFGAPEYNDVIDWLVACGFPVERHRIPARR